MSRDKNKKRSGIRVQWKIFFGLFLVAVVILLTLWSCHVFFINSFYQSVKTSELKNATGEVVRNLENENYEEIFDLIIMENDINIRIIKTDNFDDVYTGGDGFNSATTDIGHYELMRLYNLAKENGGEISQYYTYDKLKERVSTGVYNKASKGQIGVQFFPGKATPPGLFFKNPRYVDDYLYAQLVTLKNGLELMIVADVRVTPLDSVVVTLKSQLVVTSVIAFILTLMMSYFIARRISKPIVQLNASAKELASGNFDAEFSGRGYQEIEQLSDTLNYTAKELSRVDQFRRELLANVSHDLRTPLTMIVGYSEVMRDIPGENTPENVQVIIDEAKRLTEFVNNILDLSKLQSGIQTMKRERVSLTALLGDISIRYINLLRADGYSFTLESNEMVYISCDESKLLQAFLNLYDNAVNHTGEDKTVAVRQLVTGDTVRVEISDSGKGIALEELPYIWDRYYRADKNHKRSVVGSGIGLSIVKSIFEMHGVKYGVESVVNKGSTFWVEFPVLKDDDSDKADKKGEQGRGFFKIKKNKP